MSLTVGLLLLAASLLAQGFFSGSEMALVSSNRDKLIAEAENGRGSARIALDLLDREEQLLGTCLIGANLCLVTSGTLVAYLLQSRGYDATALATLVLTPLVLTFGEAVPKTLYGHYANAIAPIAARPLRAFEVLFTVPLLVVGAWSTLLKRVPREAAALSREGIVGLLEEQGPHRGGIDPEDRALIRRLFEMSETPVESCMTPLVDVVAISRGASVREATAKVLHHGHSRLAVYEERIDNIVGVLDHRDLLGTTDDDQRTVSEIVRPVRYLPESKRTSALLRELRNLGEHLAIVVDEYGGAVGLVTIEDLLEEVVGEIRDERDKAGPGIRRLGERDWRVPARLEVAEVSEAIGQPLPEGDYETVAGLVLARLGHIPEAGEVVRVAGFTLHIEQASDRAIQTIRLTAPRRSD